MSSRPVGAVILGIALAALIAVVVGRFGRRTRRASRLDPHRGPCDILTITQGRER
jgi:hypothetical protein